MDIMYRGIPADASIAMPDETMDLVEPYNYNDLVEHDNKYLSGFEAEACNMPATEIEDRAIAKAMRIPGDGSEAILPSTTA